MKVRLYLVARCHGSSGFEWQAVMTDKKATVTRAYAGADKTTGKSSDEQFSITALQKGTVSLKLLLSRSWEKETPAEEKNYTLIIE
ncbi:MAG: protease inhibitor I42 family protein [Ferruginibacter sp.]